MPVTRLLAAVLAVSLAALLAAEPLVIVRPINFTMNGQSGLQAISECRQVGTNLPMGWTLTLNDIGYTDQLELDIQLVRGTPHDRGLVILDAGLGNILINQPTHFRMTGQYPDLQLALNSLSYRVLVATHDRIDMRACRPALAGLYEESCATLRSRIEIIPGSNAVHISPCNPAPVLLAADDQGDLPDDSHTPVLAPRFEVPTTAPLVTWYRDDVLMGETAPEAGAASFHYPPVPGPGVYRYAVDHGTPAARSPDLHVLHSERLFRDPFEARVVWGNTPGPSPH